MPDQPSMTAEEVRRMEEVRLKAKSLRETSQPSGTKRAHSSIEGQPSNRRDASGTHTTAPRAAKKFRSFIEYDFSRLTDTKGGFLASDDDPYNKAMHGASIAQKPPGVSMAEWEKTQLQRKLKASRSGPYEPGLSVLGKQEEEKRCRECRGLEIDWEWDEVFKTQVCNSCKDKFPEKYSLLTKTEAKEDYLLTEPELKDESLLRRLTKTNPHKSTWNDMLLFVRYQVEEYAFEKWGGEEELDKEFERRTAEKKERKEKKFRNKLQDLKRRTRVEAYKRARKGGGGEFGDTIGEVKHVHEWGREVEDTETGMLKKTCVGCGMEVEELVV
ncbi:DNA repair protein [Piedraia hortae CBS 480.64]|uniref:DNA repair protein RAD14 n=1 Tax=Piedraia hortae CBS 480.64 TaxID=1314780 RepID=A0A6A7C4G2_9PEZI|nr:DNA repair protein [Piedraia hortae CBS 480.64]